MKNIKKFLYIVFDSYCEFRKYGCGRIDSAKITYYGARNLIQLLMALHVQNQLNRKH